MQTKYNILLKRLDEIYRVKEIYFNQLHTNFASVILFDITKKLIIMQNHLTPRLLSTPANSKEELKSVFKNYYQKLSNLTKEYRNWISVYSSKGAKEEWGFTMVKASDFKKSKAKQIIPNKEFEILVVKAINFANNCLDLCGF
ncbi:MAG: hypothetical protein ACTSUR_05635 [Candidatus Heimdallarchaeaceae archaeon]